MFAPSSVARVGGLAISLALTKQDVRGLTPVYHLRQVHRPVVVDEVRDKLESIINRHRTGPAPHPWALVGSAFRPRPALARR